jgi:hypothetical protein
VKGAQHAATGTGETYKFSSGDGQIEIKAASSATGIVNFNSGLSDENLWFVKVGNNLQVDILGSNDELTIDDWFGGSPTASVQGFTASGLKLDSQVVQLFQPWRPMPPIMPDLIPQRRPKCPALRACLTAVSAIPLSPAEGRRQKALTRHAKE